MKSRTKLPVRSDTATAVKLKLDKTFQPCPAEPDDELFPNGIFEFNITRLLAFVESDVERFPIERVEIDGIPNYGGENLDEETLGTADFAADYLGGDFAWAVQLDRRPSPCRQGKAGGSRNPPSSSRRLPSPGAVSYLCSGV